jgi:hypothetical protein
MRLVAALAFALCMACGGGNKKHTDTTPTDPIPKTAGPECGAVGEHLATLADHDAAAGPDKAMAQKIAGACKTDAWSDDARSCFATANSDDEALGCMKLLTEPQHQAFDKATRTKAKEPAAAMAPATADSEAEPAAAEPPPPPKKATTRGPVKKDKPKSRSGDPCQGGE